MISPACLDDSLTPPHTHTKGQKDFILEDSIAVMELWPLSLAMTTPLLHFISNVKSGEYLNCLNSKHLRFSVSVHWLEESAN